MYRVFKRSWYTLINNTLSPTVAKKRTVQVVENEDEARKLCYEYNKLKESSNNKLSTKYEFEKI